MTEIRLDSPTFSEEDGQLERFFVLDHEQFGFAGRVAMTANKTPRAIIHTADGGESARYVERDTREEVIDLITDDEAVEAEIRKQFEV